MSTLLRFSRALVKSQARGNVRALSSSPGASQLVQSLTDEIEEERPNLIPPDEFSEMLEDIKQKFPIVEDVAGSKEVILRRSEGGEDWEVKFSIDELMNHDDMGMDGFGDKMEEIEQQQQQLEGGRAPEEDEGEDEEMSGSLAFSVTVRKEGVPGGLRFDLVAGDSIMADPDDENPSMITVDKLVFEGSEAGAGGIAPNYDELSDALQADFRQYLESNGVDSEFAEFLLMYADVKEQREYVSWMENCKKFLE